jgi:hypothetical protein
MSIRTVMVILLVGAAALLLYGLGTAIVDARERWMTASRVRRRVAAGIYAANRERQDAVLGIRRAYRSALRDMRAEGDRVWEAGRDQDDERR